MAFSVKNGPSKPVRLTTDALRREPASVIELVTVSKQSVELTVPDGQPREYRGEFPPENVRAVILPIERYEQLLKLEADVKALAATVA